MMTKKKSVDEQPSQDHLLLKQKEQICELLGTSC